MIWKNPYRILVFVVWECVINKFCPNIWIQQLTSYILIRCVCVNDEKNWWWWIQAQNNCYFKTDILVAVFTNCACFMTINRHKHTMVLLKAHHLTVNKNKSSLIIITFAGNWKLFRSRFTTIKKTWKKATRITVYCFW